MPPVISWAQLLLRYAHMAERRLLMVLLNAVNVPASAGMHHATHAL